MTSNFSQYAFLCIFGMQNEVQSSLSSTLEDLDRADSSDHLKRPSSELPKYPSLHCESRFLVIFSD